MTGGTSDGYLYSRARRYRPLACGLMAARMWALAMSATSTMYGTMRSPVASTSGCIESQVMPAGSRWQDTPTFRRRECFTASICGTTELPCIRAMPDLARNCAVDQQLVWSKIQHSAPCHVPVPDEDGQPRVPGWQQSCMPCSLTQHLLSAPQSSLA